MCSASATEVALAEQQGIPLSHWEWQKQLCLVGNVQRLSVGVSVMKQTDGQTSRNFVTHTHSCFEP